MSPLAAPLILIITSLHSSGVTFYNTSFKQIPAAAITIEDAEMMWRMQQRGVELLINFTMTSNWSTTLVNSRNTVFELKGHEKPNEIVLLSLD